MINDPSQNKKPLIFYMAVAVIVIMLLNAFVFPMLLQRQVQEVGYSDFLKMVDSKQVSEVSMDENGEQLIFIAKGKDGQDGIYKTAVFPDNSLRQRLEDARVSFSAQIPTQNNLLISFIISWIIPIALFWALGRILSKRMMGGMNALSFGKSGAKIVASESTGVTFEDVAGEEEAKEALKEIVDFLEHPGKYASIGAKLPKGALLVGPPGTGKTLLAKAVAGEAEVPFFSISGSEFVEMFVGMGAAKVRDLFKQANEKAPCIVFIDEIDTIGKKRDTGAGIGGNDEREQTLNQLLTEMDGFDGKKGVVILAATNRPESLDPALLRPGRFDRRIPVELPDVGGREAILRVHSKGIRMADNIDLKAVARATSGASGAELANIINEAALRAVRLGRDTVTQDDLMESVETVIAGYQRKNAVMSESEKKIVSYHEIGHALVAALQTDSAPVTKITIIPRTSGALGYTMQVDEDEHYLMSREELYNKIVTLTGGQAAEQLVFHSITTGASNDIEKATRLARGMITRYGMGSFGMVALETQNSQYLGQDTSLTCSPAFAEKIDEQVVALVEEARKKADSILREHEDKLHELAAYLLNKETITGEEFMSILKAEDQKP
ncbi:ATP-dependent zinc metalloprotease FtsH [Aristaeella lactis]|uniref:Cell division protease FtsH n=1 Tax=Aristaeella lactis TaxID=3046383 RepID=A0AC61PJW0_9FIRM|nr:ATP-dependent zinc metalloprotease FtsH [Aristaeella lactis]QUA51667.1 ATP-dependent zinc metalloprotease FtsH [Aristaeella lactis]SMC48728.1 cell division protease FtsH [Aristaeella lactis]